MKTLHIDNVAFAYPARPERFVLSGLKLDIPLRPKTLIALTGASGCGKSTLLSLLLRLYDPTSGRITIEYSCDGIVGAVRHLIDTDHHWCLTETSSTVAREVFSFVPQTPIIFPGTVAQNIALEAVVGYSDLQVLEGVKQAARAAQCSEFIASLPEKYFTNLAQESAGAGRSVKLSGGQAQRITIARALYRTQCRVLLMDEPTSSLDANTKSELIGTLKSMLLGNTHSSLHCIICVTHDEAVLKAADVIVHMPVSASTHQ